MKKTLICPKCNSTKIKYIIYGYPDPTKIKKDDVLGGCEIEENSPKYHCLTCNHEWGKK